MRNLVTAVIRDTLRRPVSDVRVSIESSPVPIPDIAALSDEHGEVSITVPSAGQYSFVFAAKGYVTVHTMVEVADNIASCTTIELRSRT